MLWKKRGTAWEYVQLFLGTLLMAMAIKWIYDPVNMVTGGVSGLAIVIRFLTSSFLEGGIPLWLSTTALNVPLFLAAAYFQGFRSLYRTLAATLGLSFFLGVLPDLAFHSGDMLLTALFGGVLTGIGTGLVLGVQATTGGTDLLAALLHRWIRHYSVAQILAVLDGLVVMFGALVFGLEFALYAVVSVFVVGKISDSIIEGTKFAKQSYIISDKADEIAGEIMKRLDRGVTGLRACGMYSGKEKKVLFCVVPKKEMPRVRDIVHEIDPEAFVIVSDAREVLGEGFIEYKQ